MHDSQPPKPRRRWYRFRWRTLLAFVLLTSIGTWPHDYIATNADAIALIPHLPGFERLIAGGYYSGAPQGGLWHMDTDQKLLEYLGLEVEYDLGSRKRDFMDIHSFTAVPNEGMEKNMDEFAYHRERERSFHHQRLATHLLHQLRPSP